LVLTPGTRLGAYTITAQIGAGGMGQVYRATDTKLKRQVAIKILPPSLAADSDRLARFQREAEVLASLNHPNIGAIYGFENEGDVHALVLELVEGQTLAERLNGPGTNGIPLNEALAIARQIAEALDAAHERGIVHRDLKPANIALSPDGVVKVIDFGLAKPGTGAAGQAGEAGRNELTHSPTMMAPTVEGVLLGTAPYMSPEQARGKAVDKRTDIWAFGCVLYEIITGRRAFDGETSSDVIASILEREPDFSRLPAATPPHIVRLLARTLDKDPRTRLRDIGDARGELNVRSATGGAPPAGQRPSRFRERLAWAALVLVASAAAVLAGSSMRTAVAPAEVMFDVSFPPGVAADFTQLAISPDGRYLAAAPTFEGRAPIWLRPIGSAAGQTLPGTEGATFPFWSPDGKSIGFFAERKLKRIELDGEAVSIVTDVQVARGGMWQPDGAILFAPNASGPLFRVPASGGTAVAATHLEPGQNDHRAPFLLPDGRHFLYYSRGTPQVRGVYVARLDGSESRRLADADAAAVYAASGHLLFVRQGELFAQPFDADRLTLGGTAFRIAGSVAVNPGISLASLAASPSGAIAYVANGVRTSQFVWFDRTGSRIEALGQPEQTAITMPSLSPDERRVAFSRVVGGNWDIWLMDLHGAMSRLTSDPALDFSPIWSPDGQQIFFQSARGPGAPDLYFRSVVDATPEARLLTSRSDQPRAPSDVSADGRVLLYTVSTGTTSEIWSVPLSGDRTPHPFVKLNFNAADGRFSPDGHWVAYQSNESGRNEIYLQPFPGPGGRIPVSTGGGIQARWGRRSGELFYLAPDRRLTAVPVRIAPNGPAALGAPKPLFQMSTIVVAQFGQYAVSGDGQRFLVNNQSADPPTITMILNWKGKP
jgi:eukaryotic-like serine/threonine-protein kinase